MISRVNHKVDFFDTDAMAVVHHSNYIKWFETGRVAFLREVGITLGELMEDGYLFPITEVSAKFYHSGRFDDVLTIETVPTALTKAKMAFDYRVMRGDTLIATGHTQNVFTRRDTGKITRLSDKFYKKLAAALED